MNTLRGFTLVELMVTTGIFVFFTILIMVEHNKFNDVVLLRDLSYNVALSIREAQVYGLGVRETGTNDFASGYGLHFDATNATSYVLFADVDQNGRYQAAQDTFINRYSIADGNRIGNFCIANGPDEGCAGAGGASQIDELNIVFTRPNPDAAIRESNSSTNGSAFIILQSPRGDEIQIDVESTGQITVNNQ